MCTITSHLYTFIDKHCPVLEQKAVSREKLRTSTSPTHGFHYCVGETRTLFIKGLLEQGNVKA